jgi:tetratricopeptide (TPR) repeat protein
LALERSLFRRSKIVSSIVRQLAPLAALTLSAALVPAGALRAQGTDVPRLLIMPFRSNQKGLGSQVAEDIRQRIASDISTRQLTVVNKASVCANLEASGFSCDSAPDLLTSRLLAKNLRTEEFLVGLVDTVPGKKVRLTLTMDITEFPDATQTLPVILVNRASDLAEPASKAYQAARKEVPDFIKCMNGLRPGGDLAAAATAAAAAITIYPASTAARVCLANVLVKQNASADSILKVANKVVELDSMNKLALGLLGDQYHAQQVKFKAAGKTDSADIAGGLAVQSWARLIEVDPRNVLLVQDVVAKIALSGYAQKAVPIIQKAVDNNPGDPDLVKLDWQILLAAAASTHDTTYFRKAVIIGDEMVHVDTAAADTIYFIRQSAAYAALGEVPKAATTMNAGTAKFPLNQSIWALDSQIQRLAGNPQGALDAANKLIALDSANGHAHLLAGQAQMDLQHGDQAVAAIRQALVRRGDPRQWKTAADSARALTLMKQDSLQAGQLLLVLGNQEFKAAKAATPQKAGDYKMSVSTLQFADSVSPSADAKFLKGVSAFFVGDLSVRENQTAKRCDLAKDSQDYFLIAQLNIAAGGSKDPKLAQQLLTALNQYGPAVDGQIKRFCK